jgi:hypothetical protein
MKQFLNDIIGQMFTILGFYVAWVTLDGSAKPAVLQATLFCVFLWVLSYPLRREKEEDQE